MANLSGSDLTHARGINELLSAYLDGELQGDELERVVEHIDDCAKCIHEFHQLKEARTALRLMPMLEAPEWLLAKVGHLDSELSAYLDAELTTAEVPMVIDHLRECARCRDELHLVDTARTAVRSMPRAEPPGLLHVIRAGRTKRKHSRWMVVAASAGVAAAVVLTLGFVSSTSQFDPVDLVSFSDRHIARASVESGFSIFPAFAPGAVLP